MHKSFAARQHQSWQSEIAHCIYLPECYTNPKRTSIVAIE